MAARDCDCAPSANRCAASVVTATGEALLTVVVLRFVAFAVRGKDEHEWQDTQQREEGSDEQREVDGA